MSAYTITSEKLSVSETYNQRQSCSYTELENKNTLDYLNDQELINHVQEKETELKNIRLENRIFFQFLQENEPVESEGLENVIITAIKKICERKSFPIMKFPMNTNLNLTRGSSVGSRRSSRLSSFSSMSSALEGRGPKINLNCKSDMVLKAIEDIQVNLTSFLKKSQRIRRNLKAELEEYAIREKDIKEFNESFGYNIMVQGIDPLTQRIPAEKFERWMEEWLKSAQLNIEKLRFRTVSLKILYRKVSAILAQRQELGENVRAVDFDQLQIENKHFAEKTDQKNFQLIQLKKMSGRAGLVLTNNKKILRKLQDEYNELKAQMAERQRTIEEGEQECEDAEEELKKSKEQYGNFKKLSISHKVPSVMEYVGVKSQLADLKNEIKIWYRRKKIQDITINACLRQMKNITGNSKIHPLWLEDLSPKGTINSGR